MKIGRKELFLEVFCICYRNWVRYVSHIKQTKPQATTTNKQANKQKTLHNHVFLIIYPMPILLFTLQLPHPTNQHVDQ